MREKCEETGKMRDRSMSIWMSLTFGVPGLAVLMLAWLWPALEEERNIAIFIGAAGLLAAAIIVLFLIRSLRKMGSNQVPVEVQFEEKV
jgi:predicted exporter